MFYHDLILLIGFFLVFMFLAWFLAKKMVWDKLNRKKTLERLFVGTFGLVGIFFTLEPWFLIGAVDTGKGVNPVGIGQYFGWWGPLAFITGVFLGILVLAFIYKSLQKIVIEFDIRNFFGFLKIRYSKVKVFINIIAYLSMVIFLPMFFYQFKLLSEVLKPFANPYFSLTLFSLLLLLLFFFLGNKDRIVTYLAVFIVFLVWLVLGFVNSYQNQTVEPYFFTTPPIELFGTLVFLGFAFYLVFPKNFLAYSDRKIELLGIPTLSRSLIFWGIGILFLLLLTIPYGGWVIKPHVLNQKIFIMCLILAASLSYLFVLRIVIYESFKKYTLSTRNTATLFSGLIFLATILLGNYFVDLFRLNYSDLALISLTYIPVLIPGFVGGFAFKRARGLNFILSYTGGLVVWLYLAIGMRYLNLNFAFLPMQSNLITQTFYPFLAAGFLYLLPLVFPRKPDMIAMSFSQPEKMIIESFIMDIESRKG